jgi:hypothetical protein
MTLVDLIVVGAIVVVLPLALGGSSWPWLVAGSAALVSFLLPTGAGALLVAPFLVACLGSMLVRLRAMWLAPLASPPLGDIVASAYAVVSAVALAHSRLGVELGGVGEPIVELTAVHFAFAGAASLVLALGARDAAAGRARSVGSVAVFATGCAPPVVALGFTSHSALAQIGGAVLMSIGVCLTASLHIREAVRRHPSAERWLLAVSGIAVWIPMVLAVSWAAGQHLDVPALSIDLMVRTHGLPNAIAFVLCGLLARRLPVRHAAHRERVAA